MKTSINQICFAVKSYYEGMPLSNISKRIDKEHNIYIADSTIYKWVNKFSQKGTDETKDCHPIVSDTWIAHETIVKCCGKDYYLTDIVDVDTQFMLSSIFSQEYDPEDIDKALESAKEKASKTPECLIILKSNQPQETTKLKNRIKSDNIRMLFATEEEKATLLNQIRGSYHGRNRVLLNIKKQEYIQKILNGWLFHYNFRRANRLLNGKTPAESSEIHFVNVTQS
jgi:transposase-like protein